MAIFLKLMLNENNVNMLNDQSTVTVVVVRRNHGNGYIFRVLSLRSDVSAHMVGEGGGWLKLLAWKVQDHGL